MEQRLGQPFAAFILTNRRPDRVITYTKLRRGGYTGRIYLVVDNEDPTLAEYQNRYPGEVLVFDKAEAASASDSADNLPDRRTVLYARNATWQLARQAGVRYFAMLDDDYKRFVFRRIVQPTPNTPAIYPEVIIRDLDGVFTALTRFLATTSANVIAFSQGGDHFGGIDGRYAPARLTRKAMNLYILDTHRPFPWLGRLNDDVNTYVVNGARGRLFLTHSDLMLDQHDTQTNPGGLTETYLRFGTYTKSMYTVMMAPSAARVVTMGTANPRLHHAIRWNQAVPLILPARHRKPREEPTP